MPPYVREASPRNRGARARRRRRESSRYHTHAPRDEETIDAFGTAFTKDERDDAVVCRVWVSRHDSTSVFIIKDITPQPRGNEVFGTKADRHPTALLGGIRGNSFETWRPRLGFSFSSVAHLPVKSVESESI